MTDSRRRVAGTSHDAEATDDDNCTSTKHSLSHRPACRTREAGGGCGDTSRAPRRSVQQHCPCARDTLPRSPLATHGATVLALRSGRGRPAAAVSAPHPPRPRPAPPRPPNHDSLKGQPVTPTTTTTTTTLTVASMRAALSAAVSATHASHRPIAHVAGRDDGGKPRVLLLAAAVDPQSDPWILLKAKRHHGAFTIGAPASLEHLVSVEHESVRCVRYLLSACADAAPALCLPPHLR